MTSDSDTPRDIIPTGSIRWDSSWPELAEKNDRDAIFSFLYERFGIPGKVFQEYLLFNQRSGWYLLHASALTEDVSRMKVSRVGLNAFRKVGQFVKPTTRFIQIFGKFATKRVCQISSDTLSRLVAGEQIPVDQDYKKGYVILAINKNCILGLGFFIHGKIRSQLPGGQLRTTMITNFPCHLKEVSSCLQKNNSINTQMSCYGA